jgi:hypothetical protein
MGAVSHGVRLLWMRLHGLWERTQDQGTFGQCSRRWRMATKCPEALMARIGVMQALNRDRPVPEPGPRRKGTRAYRVIR